MLEVKYMGRLRIAVPTKTHAGLEDVVSEVFGKAKTFTRVDVKDGEVKNVQVINNPATSYEYGSGPVAMKTLADLKVNLVTVVELVPGATSLLEHSKIDHVSVKPNTKVANSIKDVLSRAKAEQA
jgi:predicted Fe-Mo cluster-binding NifX family protein